MSFAGEIKTMPLHDLLQWIELNQKSGVLELSSGGAARRFAFLEGLVAQVTSTEHPAAARESDVRRILAESLHWTKGRFQFVEKPVESRPSLGLSSKRLLLDAFRELDEMRRTATIPTARIASRTSRSCASPSSIACCETTSRCRSSHPWSERSSRSRASRISRCAI